MAGTAACTGGTTTPPTPEQVRAQLTPEQRMIQQAAQAVPNELMQAKMLRAVMSERQLEEVLVDFWFNHFNVFIGKGQVRQYLTEYERDVIRRTCSATSASCSARRRRARRCSSTWTTSRARRRPGR